MENVENKGDIPIQLDRFKIKAVVGRVPEFDKKSRQEFDELPPDSSEIEHAPFFKEKIHHIHPKGMGRMALLHSLETTLYEEPPMEPRPRVAYKAIPGPPRCPKNHDFPVNLGRCTYCGAEAIDGEVKFVPLADWLAEQERKGAGDGYSVGEFPYGIDECENGHSYRLAEGYCDICVKNEEYVAKFKEANLPLPFNPFLRAQENYLAAFK